MARKLRLILVLLIIVLIGYFAYVYYFKNVMEVGYLASNMNMVKIYDLDFKEVNEIVRGTAVESNYQKINKDDVSYVKIRYENSEYLVHEDNLRSDKDVVLEDKVYIRTTVSVYEDASSVRIFGMIPKGSEVSVTGYDKLNSDGSVNKYKVKYKDIEGYIYGKYTVFTLDEAKKVYDNGYFSTHNKRIDRFGGGDAASVDYYPYEKPHFEDNVMPNEVRAIYLNVEAVSNIDKYISLAQGSDINAFVVDIKENTIPAYKGDVFKEYSITNYEHARYSVSEYKELINKARDAGIYLIGRISTFKDEYYVKDHANYAILDSSGNPYKHNNTYWPSAYNRKVWEYNVSLACEAVKEFGFNEIQFDYVRFPDRTYSLEKNGTINLNNVYSETKAQAIQLFLMYASDELHKLNAYVSADVFGEAANSYVTGYGQYWPAISNVVDVISAMPYPDHFNAHEYGIKEYVWLVPYELLKYWGASVKIRQSETTTPAVVRTWIQAYNSIKKPYVIYDADKISEQIDGLYENGLTGGYMTWNSASSLSKYKEISKAFRRRINEED